QVPSRGLPTLRVGPPAAGAGWFRRFQPMILGREATLQPGTSVAGDACGVRKVSQCCCTPRRAATLSLQHARRNWMDNATGAAVRAGAPAAVRQPDAACGTRRAGPDGPIRAVRDAAGVA